ncbi:hypothetical protein ACQP3J_31960, partial [Escherichia coli]
NIISYWWGQRVSFRKGKLRKCKARKGKAKQGKARQGKAWILFGIGWGDKISFRQGRQRKRIQCKESHGFSNDFWGR